MIKYNENSINKWYYNTSDLIKVYYHDAVCYYKLTPGGTQVPCYAVVADISQYTDREFEDVFNQADGKWYKLNNLNQYEEYGIYGSGRTITYYPGKLTIDDGYEYQYSGNSWANVGAISGSSRLPQGYTEVEYIEDSGSQYIDTGVYLDTSNFEVGCEVINSHCFWGYCHQDSANGTWLGIESTTSQQTAFYGKFISSDINNISSYLSSVENTIVYTQSGVTVNGSVLSKSLTMGSDNIANKSLVFFGRYDFNINNIEWRTNSKFKSFYVKNNGTLVRDFVPAKRDSDDKYGMYDLVTETFYTSPNGNSFSGGAETGETVYPVYYTELQDPPNYLSFSSMTEAESYECPWVGMKATIAGSGYTFNSNYEWEYIPSRLPVGYTEVEYIENTSTAYINTEVLLYDSTTNSYNIQCKCYFQPYGNDFEYLFGTEGTSSPYVGVTFRYYRRNIQYASNPDNVSWTHIDNGDGTSGITASCSSTTATNDNNPLTLFCGLWSTGPWRNGRGKIYSFKVTKNDTLVRDLVPTKRDSDNKYGMYDLITDTFYTSPNGNNFSGGDPV